MVQKRVFPSCWYTEITLNMFIYKSSDQWINIERITLLQFESVGTISYLNWYFHSIIYE